MKKLIAVALILLLGLGSLSACKAESIFKSEEDTSIECPIKVGSYEVSEADYKALMLEFKTLMLGQEDASDTREYWLGQSGEDNMTISDYLLHQANEALIREKLFLEQFDALGLKLSETQQEAIDQAQAAAGEEALKLVSMTKKNMVLDYYFGQEGTLRPLSDQDIKDYYNVHYVCVKRIVLDKVDADGKLLDEAALAAVAEKAQSVYELAAESEEDNFDALLAEYSVEYDPKETDYRMVYNENSIGDPALFQELSLMELGGVLLHESDKAYVVLKRCDATADDLFTSTDRMEMMEQIRADELEELIAEWREKYDVRINTEIIEKYRPENLK
ncbi:MAG: hypothetical protein IJC46_08185 [Clostridia bacterium]|nr:hypothetical protein [Clostridia bacterium]